MNTVNTMPSRHSQLLAHARLLTAKVEKQLAQKQLQCGGESSPPHCNCICTHCVCSWSCLEQLLIDLIAWCILATEARTL